MAKFLTVLLLAVSAAGCAPGNRMDSEPLTVSLVSVAPLEMNVFEQRFAMKLRVQNPRPHEVPLQGISFDLDINGKSFARGTGQTDKVIPAFGEEVVDVTAVSTLPDLLSRIRDLSTMEEGVRYRLQGRLYQGKAGGYERFNYGGDVKLDK